MLKKTEHPHLLEINAFFWLSRLERGGERLTLAAIPDREIEAIAKCGFHYVWLMGVWKRSPAGIKLALENEPLKAEFDRCLPGWKKEDVTGSPYAVYGYELDPRLGTRQDLVALRQRLAKLGIGLFLDLVPNHLAFDHPWTEQEPALFVNGTEAAFRDYPGLFYRTPSGRYLAHGKDPYFTAWNDTVQINIFSWRARTALIKEMLKVAELCDGIRCDMAMLLLTDVFEKNWRPFLDAAQRPKMEFWAEAITAVKAKFPQFMFMAEVYWGLDRKLQELGFEYTYDKTFYDRLKHDPALSIREHLGTEPEYQKKCVRFLENHDEERAAALFGKKKSLAFAAILATAPGMRFFHEGQPEGRVKRTLIHLGREAPEPADPEISEFYLKLFRFAKVETLHAGQWLLLEGGPSSEADATFRNVLAWVWSHGDEKRMVVVNDSAQESRVKVRVPKGFWEAEKIFLYDHLSREVFERSTYEVTRQGLDAALGAWQCRLFEIRTQPIFWGVPNPEPKKSY